jgi:threonylcarbamoyladenosine tRNA methylthiotransferase MtaB
LAARPVPAAAPLSVHLETLGCRLNEAELEAWARQFRSRGCRIAGAEEPADLVVVNTCAVTAAATRKSRRLLRRLKRRHPAARLVVSGCAASLADVDLGDARIDLVVDNADKDRLVELAAAAQSLPPRLPGPDPDADGAETLFARGRQRAFVKVQDGCRYQCTFCITTVARGAERSRALADIVAEVNTVAGGDTGVQEVVLTGVQLGGYGRDQGVPGLDLARLVHTLLAETDVPRIRLGSVEPWDLPAGFWRLFEDPRLMPHLHLPLQSGADSVLTRMARRCRSDAFRALVGEARAAVPDIGISTDIIVGFPGETDAEWQATMDLVAELGFGQLHVFAYSPRAGTRAATMPAQVPEPVKRERARQLAALGAVLKAASLDARVGQTLPVLIEGEQEDAAGRYAGGFTPDYLPVRLRDVPPELVSRIAPARLLRRSADDAALEACLAPADAAPGRRFVEIQE